MKRTLAILAVTAVLAGCGERKTESETLVLSTWGFSETLYREHIFAPFEEENSVKIVLEVGNNSDRLNKLRMRQDSQVDLIWLSDYFAMQGVDEGLFETIEYKNVPNIEKIYSVAQSPTGKGYGPAYTVTRLGVIFDSAEVEISSWADLWSSALKGRITIPNISTTQGPMMLGIAAKVAGIELTDDDALFQSAKGLVENSVKLYGVSSEVSNMFNQGEIVAAPALNFLFERVKKSVETAQWVDPKEGSFAVLNTINIVKGSEKKELAERFINWLLSREAQTIMALYKLDSPVNSEVELTPEQAEGLTYGDIVETLNTLEWEYVNEKQRYWIERWNNEM